MSLVLEHQLHHPDFPESGSNFDLNNTSIFPCIYDLIPEDLSICS